MLNFRELIPSAESAMIDDLSGDPFPTAVYQWGMEDTPSKFSGNPGGIDGTFFGYLFRGARLMVPDRNFNAELEQGMYFACADRFSLDGGAGLLIRRDNWQGMFMIGGPIEATGRLRYIDGCTDSLLIPPVKMGDPCLNLLHFPPGIDQTKHTHPSNRVGIVVRGHGRCVTPDGVIDLKPGMLFNIPTGGVHKFQTADEIMDVIAWHPDSDFGPQDQDHPMVNRTLVGDDETPANQIDAIRTR